MKGKEGEIKKSEIGEKRRKEVEEWGRNKQEKGEDWWDGEKGEEEKKDRGTSAKKQRRGW